MTPSEYFKGYWKYFNEEEFNKIVNSMRYLYKTSSVCPSLKNIFKAFELCPLDNLRVVIIGQDPYPFLYKGSPIATGIAFGNAKDTPIDKFSPSLEVLRESVIDYTRPHGNINFDPSLEKWEEQGVLLLNTALSCQQGVVGSHTLIWKPFISSFLSSLSNYKSGVVYVLLGQNAFKMESYINHKNNYILKDKHPSWYARNKQPMPHIIWQNINNILVGQNGYGIKWYEEDDN